MLNITLIQFSSVHSLSRVRLFATPRTAVRQAFCLSPTPGVYSNSCPLGQWCHPTISSFVTPFSYALNLPQHQGLSQWVGSSHQTNGTEGPDIKLHRYMVNWSLTEVPRIYNEKRIVSLYMVLGKLGIYMQKSETEPYLILYTKLTWNRLKT